MTSSGRTLIVLAGALALSACAALNGPRPAISDLGPVKPPIDHDHPKYAIVPLYELFSAAWSASYANPGDGPSAMTMEKTGIAVVKQNCADYFDSTGRTERYLLFGRDVTTFAAAVGTAALVAAHASTGAIGGFALGSTNLIAANDTLRKQLTYGADFTNSARTMVEGNLATFETAILSKNAAGYDFLTAVSDLHDFQTLCVPATIIANMNVAIATKKFVAIPVQAASAPTTGTAQVVGSAPKAADQIQAGQVKQQLMSLQDKNLLLGPQVGEMIQGLSAKLDTLASGQPVAVPAAPVRGSSPADARAKIVLRPASE